MILGKEYRLLYDQELAKQVKITYRFMLLKVNLFTDGSSYGWKYNYLL